MISYDEKLENFCILLSDDASTASATLSNLPTNEDGVKALMNMENVETVNSGNTGVEINELRVVMWIEKNNKIQWYLGYILSINEDNKTLKVDHLQRSSEGQNKFWKYPKSQDKCEIEKEQLLNVVEIKGRWTTDNRNRQYI